MSRLLVIGATGDVGQGIVRTALARGWDVVAAGRDQARLARLATNLGEPAALELVRGDLASEAGAAALRDDALAAGGIDDVVVSVNAPTATGRQLLDWSMTELDDTLRANLLAHFNAAKLIIPALAPGRSYVAIGGGTADFVIPGAGHLSLCQAAQRMMFRAIARERRASGVHIRELMIVSMVNGESKRAIAADDWLTDDEIGMQVVDILTEPHRFPGPILTLTSGGPGAPPRIA